ncbi:MAG: hypothetical protein ABJO05_05835 [Roseibium sp.]
MVAQTFGAKHAIASGIPSPGDFYLIARDRVGDFSGSHKVFRRTAVGLHKVSYCKRDYWVRAHTVAWTLVEAENNRAVRLEFNFGKGWRPICDHPEQQVTLSDIGLAGDPREILAKPETNSGALSLFGVISKSLREDVEVYGP